MDFGASDGPMNDDQMAAVQGNVLHVPTVMGAVVLTYNLPSRRRDQAQVRRRRRSPTSSWARSPSGMTRRWPSSIPVSNFRSRTSSSSTARTGRERATSSPTISRKVSPEWKEKVGKATSVNWPIGLGGKGNEGVTQQVKQTEGAIGYVELIYALSNKLPYADVKNAAGDVRRRLTAVGDRGGCERQVRTRTPISGCRSPTHPGKAHIRSRPSPGCWFIRTRPDAAKGEGDQGLPRRG